MWPHLLGSMALELICERLFENEAVCLDGKHFKNCQRVRA